MSLKNADRKGRFDRMLSFLLVDKGRVFFYKFVLRGTDDFLTFLTVSRQEISVSRFFGKCKFEIKSYRFNFVGKASASLSLDGTLSKTLAMKFIAVSFFPVITSSLASYVIKEKAASVYKREHQYLKKAR